MVKMLSSLGNIALILSIAMMAVVAHPGENIWEQFAKREEHLNNPERRTVGTCRRSLEAEGHHAHELARRSERINSLRLERGLEILSGPLDARQNPSCTLDPESTEGPFWVSGELIRTDLREQMAGVELHLDINIIDVSNCKPIPDIYVELWGCNSTGVYTGVVSKGNGAGLAAPDEINNSALRGVVQANKNGTASFVTLVPGHYVGRTNHLHVVVHHGATRLANNTIQGGTISHVGQFYFDQGLLRTVEATAPYSTNRQAITTNAVDSLIRQAQGNRDDPIIKMTTLGSTVADGLHGVIDVGVNPNARRNPSPVNKWTAKGGVPNQGSMWAGYPWTKKQKARQLEPES